jgi:hypothetical protein
MMDDERGPENGLQQKNEYERKRCAPKDTQNNPPRARNGGESETVKEIGKPCGEENEQCRV